MCQAVVEEDVPCRRLLVPALLRGSLEPAPLPGCSRVRVVAVPRFSVVPGCSSGRRGLCLWFLAVWHVLLRCGLGLPWQRSWAGPWLQGERDRNWGWDSAVPDNSGSHHCEGSWEKVPRQSRPRVASPHTLSNHPARAAAALASGRGQAGDDPVLLPLPGGFWLFWALWGQFHWIWSVGLAQLRLVFGPGACSGWDQGLCPAWVSDVYQDVQHTPWLPTPAPGQGEGGQGKVLGQARPWVGTARPRPRDCLVARSRNAPH